MTSWVLTLVSPQPGRSFGGIEIGAGLNDGWISGIDLLRLAERSVGCCEIAERNRGTRRGDKDRHPAVLLPVALSLGRPQFPSHIDDFRRIGIDSLGLAERALRRGKVAPLDGPARPFNQRAELATSGAHLGNVPPGLSDLGEAGRRLVGVLQGRLGTREIAKGREAPGVGDQVSRLTDLGGRGSCRRCRGRGR